MITRKQCQPCWINLMSGCLVFCFVSPVFAKQAAEVELTDKGKQLRQLYGDMLEQLSEEVVASLPDIDTGKRMAFEEARSVVSSLTAPGENAGPKEHLEFQKRKSEAEARVLEAARAMISECEGVLSSGALDSKLIKVAILRHGTPEGLAEFAQQGDEERALLDRLLSDESLMRQMAMAGGANGGEYGEAMQVYTAILDASDHAKQPGILQCLALGTALHQPWLEGKKRGSINGIVFTDNENPDGQVARYLHYEKAFLAGELDPAFKDFNAWECRFITNDPYTNEELAWGRQMLRNFRPDHITNANHSWRYVGLVKSDLPYCSTTHDESLGTSQQQALALGGVCGRRAFFGRFITRAFGIPARRSTQTGHAAMNFWTPDGWVVRLGAWWSMNWCGPQGGLDFYLDSQAREFPELYMRVLRAQWIGDALSEDDVDLRQYDREADFGMDWRFIASGSSLRMQRVSKQRWRRSLLRFQKKKQDCLESQTGFLARRKSRRLKYRKQTGKSLLMVMEPSLCLQWHAPVRKTTTRRSLSCEVGMRGCRSITSVLVQGPRFFDTPSRLLRQASTRSVLWQVRFPQG